MDIITPVLHAFYAVFCATYYVFIFFSGVFGMYISYSIFEAKFTEKGRTRVHEMMSQAEEQRKMHDEMMSANNDGTNDELSDNDSTDDDSTDDEQKNSSPTGSDSEHKKTK